MDPKCSCTMIASHVHKSWFERELSFHFRSYHGQQSVKAGNSLFVSIYIYFLLFREKNHPYLISSVQDSLQYVVSYQCHTESLSAVLWLGSGISGHRKSAAVGACSKSIGYQFPHEDCLAKVP